MLRLFCMSFNGSVNLGKAILLQLCVSLMCTAEDVLKVHNMLYN